MRILTVDNTVFEIDQVPDQIDDVRFGVFDTTDPDFMDYYFLPLIFLESFYAPAICLQIGEHNIQMPMDWSIAITDEDLSGVEVIPLTSLNNRGFLTVGLNPLSGSLLSAEEIKITNIFQDVKWFFPKLKNGHMLMVPLEDKENPKCAMFVKEANKIPQEIDIGHLID
jgi:hypothetical protein|tara:strand:- start:62 stop:565 length:504 start_codon:yes stop_codon:yes gene_type:complete